jgi:hypothetical protein
MEDKMLITKFDDMAILNDQGVNDAKVGVDLSEVTDTTTTKNRKKKEARKRKKEEENKRRLEEEELLATAAAENALFPSTVDNKTPKIEDGNTHVRTTKANAVISLLSTSDYALEIKAIPGKGLGVFATKNIKAGTKFFKETPLIASVGEWLPVEASCASLDSTIAKKYLWPLMSSCHCGRNPCKETPIMRIWDTNHFDISRKIQDISTAYSSETKSISCVYAVASYINHACNGNSTYGLTKNLDIVFLANRNISRGEEITHCYNTVTGPVQLRRKMILGVHHFICKCSACVKGQTIAHCLPPECVEISESDAAHLKAVNVVDAASKQRVELANDWGATVFNNLALCIESRSALGKIGGTTGDGFCEDATTKIIKRHGDWLKLHNHFDCMGETIKIDEDVIQGYLERLPNLVRGSLKNLEPLMGNGFPAGNFLE